MSDDELAEMLARARGDVQRLKGYWSSTVDVPERDAALVTGRQLAAVERYLERWITSRACRAVLQR